ncbi:MAG: YdcF family protein [Actinomycetota bacterium]
MRSLIDPVWLLLIVLATSTFVRFQPTKTARLVKTASRVALVALIFLSTGVATKTFDRILATKSTPRADWSPEFIFVLGGGYEVGGEPAQYFLGTESIRRVNAAAKIWRKYPAAKVVFSGGQPGTEGDRPSTRHGELAASWAKNLGLADARIVIEPLSQNTRQHPIEALKLAGVDKNSELAIVTSDFHLRRSLGEFKKHFTNVASFGTGDSTGGLSWLDFVPLATHLDENAYRIKEFAGIGVSKLRN